METISFNPFKRVGYYLDISNHQSASKLFIVRTQAGLTLHSQETPARGRPSPAKLKLQGVEEDYELILERVPRFENPLPHQF